MSMTSIVELRQLHRQQPLTEEQRELFPMAALLYDWWTHAAEAHDDDNYHGDIVNWHYRTYPDCDAGLSQIGLKRQG